MKLKLNVYFLFLLPFLLVSCSEKEAMYCGFDDGPFSAVKTELLAAEDQSTILELSKDGSLLIDNQNDSLPPIISLYEEGQLEWSVMMYLEDWFVDSIYNIELHGDSRVIKLSFFAKWTFGNESGSMKIDRSTGDNNYCLSW